MRQHALASSGNTDNALREAHDVIDHNIMGPLRFSKLWHPRRYRRKRSNERDTPRPRTIGSGMLPVEILQEIFAHLDLFTLLRCCQVCRLWNQCIPGDSPSLRMAMFLPTLKHNASRHEMAPINAFKFNFGVNLHGDFQNLEDCQICRPVTDFTVRPRSSEPARLQIYDIALNLILESNITRTQLQRYKASWESPEKKKPFWMTLLVSQPPIQRLTIHFEFLDTALILEECWVVPHTTSRTLINPTGIVLGDLLSATHDSMWWKEMRLSRREGRHYVSTRLLPSVQQETWGKDEGSLVLDRDLPILSRENVPNACSR
jgi:hypothetical protein